MEKQVSFDTTLYILDKHDMIECKPFSKFHSFPYQDDRGQVSRIFRRLPLFSHVTSAHLEIWIPDVDEALSSYIANYIAKMSALKQLHPSIWLLQVFPEAVKIGWAVILELLRRNTRVNDLHEFTRYMSGPDIQQNVSRAHVRVQQLEIAAVFVRRLRDGNEDNYRLLHLTVDGCSLSRSIVGKEWFAV
ncbi:hypothetical protein HPB51_018336 [Rhipicephalus microplus]|uniref:Uncharacterized protein n=1 Tax=Rhipicephalus microplus TaxID=6941 RepID=A0A9J6EUS1_RHIMP|nr:hypothetical protein HPB51_018336 [Rhipicephalus microplus]